jgi:hypothetical protein
LRGVLRLNRREQHPQREIEEWPLERTHDLLHRGLLSGDRALYDG